MLRYRRGMRRRHISDTIRLARAAIGMALATSLAALCTLAVEPSPEQAAAIGPGTLHITLVGQAGITASAVIGLRDPDGNDVAPAFCTSQPSTTIVCNGLAMGDYTFSLVAPASGVGFRGGCASLDLSVPEFPVGTIPVTAANGEIECRVGLWPLDGSGPVTAPVHGTFWTPSWATGEPQLQFLDAADADHFADLCTISLTQFTCTPSAAGHYRLAVASLPSGATADYACVAHVLGPDLPSPTDIELSGATHAIFCEVVIGDRTLEVRVPEELAGLQITVNPLGQPGSPIACTWVDPRLLECPHLAAGTFEIHHNLSALGATTIYPTVCGRYPDRVQTIDAPPVFAGAGTLLWICAFGWLAFEPTTTTVAPTTTVNRGLPATGRSSGPLWPAALLLAGAGAALSLLARRPLR